MNRFGFLQFIVCLRVFSSESPVLLADARPAAEKPRYADFFPDILRMGRSALSASPRRNDLCGLGRYQGDGHMRGAVTAKTMAGHRLRHQSGVARYPQIPHVYPAERAQSLRNPP